MIRASHWSFANLNIDCEPMGILVPPNDSDAVFGESIRQAMWALLDGRD
jgi:hypothetical protein